MNRLLIATLVALVAIAAARDRYGTVNVKPGLLGGSYPGANGAGRPPVNINIGGQGIFPGANGHGRPPISTGGIFPGANGHGRPPISTGGIFPGANGHGRPPITNGGQGGFNPHPSTGGQGGYNPGSGGRGNCRYWCKTPRGQAYCCESGNKRPGPVGIKPGKCPPSRIECPHSRFGPPKTCSNDGSCYGKEKCCFDTCLDEHVCKPPLY